MTKKEFKDKLMAMPYDKRAKYVNKVKAAAEETEYWNLIQLEFDDYIEGNSSMLKSVFEDKKILTLVVRNQGASAVQDCVLKPWETDNKGENDARG